MLNTTWRICREIFDTAKADGRFIGDNPATSLKATMKKHVGKNRKALPWEAMNGFLHRLDAGRLNPETIACIRLMMMTATRPGEAREATWAEFNLDAALWSIPAARMKTRKPHVIPLSHQCVSALRTLHVITGHGECLFPSQRGSKAKTLSNMGLLQGIRAIAGTDDVDAHGFRATFRTHAEEANLWTEAAMEGALGHGKKDAVKAAYDRAKHLPERTKLAQWYSDQLDLAQHGAKVIKLRA
jgi:integrase